MGHPNINYMIKLQNNRQNNRIKLINKFKINKQ